MLEAAKNALLTLPAEIATLLIGMAPLAELRLAIPIGNSLGLTPFEAFFYGALGNIIVVIPIVFFLKHLEDLLCARYKWWKKFFKNMYEKTHSKHSKSFQKYGPLALILFVSIPLPGTGGWTGAIAATVFGIPPKKAWKLMTLGIIIAGIIVSLTWSGFTTATN